MTFSPQNSCCLWDNVDKYGTAEQATGGNKIWHMRFAPTSTQNTNYLLIFHSSNGYANA